jgi:hypothetical protein
MSHFFNCIEEKAIHELDEIQLMITKELEETGAYVEDMAILSHLDYIKEKLKNRILRTADRCREEGCIRKATHFDSKGVSKCKYH